MLDRNKSKAQLIEELREIRQRVSELENNKNAHKQMEQALLKSEEKYHRLFNSMEEGIAINELVLDENDDVIDYIVLDVNPAFEKQSPYSIDESLGKHATDLYQMSTEYIRDWWRTHSNQKEAVHTEIYHEPSSRWFHIMTMPPEGTRFATIFTDITERKQAEEARQKILEQFKALIGNLHMGVLVESADRKIIQTNHTFCKLFGIPMPEAILGKSCDAASQGVAALFQDPAYFVERIKDILDKNEVIVDEELYLTDGRVFERDYVPINFQGEFLGNMWLYRDITDRKREEEKFRDSEKRYRLIAENAEDLIWTMNMELQLTYVSPSVERALGYTAREIMSLTPAHLLTPESFTNGIKVFNEEVATARPEPDPNYARVLEMEYRRKDGSTFWVEMKFSFFRNVTGQLTGVLGVGRDITDRKQIEESLDQRAKELQSLQKTVLEITNPYKVSNLLQTIVERAADLIEADSGGLYLCDSDRQEVRCVVSYNTPKDFTGVTLRYGEGAAGLVAQTGKALIVDDYRTWSGSAIVFDDEKPFERLISAPMLWQSQVIGVIHVLRSTGDIPFSQDDLELLSLFAHHAAITVTNAQQLDSLKMELTERKRAEQKIHAYARQMSLLNELTRAALETPDLHTTYQMLADRMGELLEADGAYLTLWDEGQQRTIPLTAYGSMREKYSTLKPEAGEMTLTESVLRTGHVLVVEDVSNTPYLSPRIAAMFPARSILALPMIAGQQKLGAVLIGFNKPHNFTQEVIAFGEQTARQIALVVSRLRNLQETQRLAQEQSLLFKAARDFSAGLDEKSVLSAIAQHMTTALQVDGCTISHYEPEQGQVVTMLDFDSSPEFQPESVGRIYRLADYPVTQRVIESRQPFIVHVDDPNANPAELVVLEKNGYETMMMLPLAVGDRVSGLVELSRRSGAAPFSDSDLQLAQNLANTAVVALENGRLHAEVQSLAITDSLTGLANRRAFDRVLNLEIARAVRYGHTVALLFIDMDSFKQYNDTYGHPAGDERLKAIAHMLQENVRHPDLVARYGGEEFIIILPYSAKASALISAERLRNATRKTYIQTRTPEHVPIEETKIWVDNQPVPGYTISIGVAAYPEDAQTAEGLLRAADEAALTAKRRGKNRVCAAPVPPSELI